MKTCTGTLSICDCYTCKAVRRGERHDQQVDNAKGFESRSVVIDVDQPYTPQVGEECEVEYEGEWIKTYIIGIDRDENFVFELPETVTDLCYDGINVNGKCFKPLKTERDIAIEKGMKINRTLCIGATEQEMFGALYDAGLIK